MYRTDPPIVGCLHHDIFTYLTLRVVVFLKGIYGIEQIQLEGCPAESLNLKVFWNFKKLAFFVFFFSRCNSLSQHKQTIKLEFTGVYNLVFTIMHIKCLSYYLYKYSIIYHPQEIRSLYTYK